MNIQIKLHYMSFDIWALCGRNLLLDQKMGENIWNVEVIWPSSKCVLLREEMRTQAELDKERVLLGYK